MTKSLNDTMAIMYVDYYNEHGEEKTQDLVLKGSVSTSVLLSFYGNFIKDGILPIEQISKELKEKYYKIACRYYDNLPEQLRATRAAYTLALITSTD